jgi:predicted MFS family arabinose efflux permease
VLRAIGSAYRDAYSGIRPTVWLLAAVSLVNRAGTMVVPFLVLYLTSQKGFTAAAAGGALSIYGVGSVAGSYLGGWLCDRLSPRRVMVASLLAGGAGFLALGSLDRRGPILAMIFGLSLACEAFRPANGVAIAAASAPGRIAQSLALYRLAINLGMTVGPAAGGLLARRSYAWLFRVDAASSIAAGVLLALGLRRASGGPAQAAAARELPAAGARASLLRDGSFVALLLLTLLASTVVMQTFGAWTLTLRDRYHLGEAQVGAVFAISTLLIVLFEMVLVRTVAGRDPLPLIGLGSFLFSAGLALLPLGSSFAFVVGTVVVSTVGEMLLMPLLGAVFAGWGPEESRGEALGLFGLAFALGFVLAPLAGTWIYERLGPATLWYGCGAAGLVSWAGYAALAAFRRRRSGRTGEGREAPAEEGSQPSLASLR